jgi:prepilin peptidase CpaA
LAYLDFWYLTLPNRIIAALTFCAALYVWLAPDRLWQTALLAALLLFAIGTVFWLLRLMGAGDAKLMLPLGILIDLSGFIAFAIGLLGLTLVLYVSIKLAGKDPNSQHALIRRLSEINNQGKVPFGLPLISATMLVLALQHMP